MCRLSCACRCNQSDREDTAVRKHNGWLAASSNTPCRSTARPCCCPGSGSCPAASALRRPGRAGCAQTRPPRRPSLTSAACPSPGGTKHRQVESALVELQDAVSQMRDISKELYASVARKNGRRWSSTMPWVERKCHTTWGITRKILCDGMMGSLRAPCSRSSRRAAPA